MGEAQKNPLLEGVTSGLFGMVVGYAWPRGAWPRGVKLDRVTASYRCGVALGLFSLSYLIDKRGVDDIYTTIGSTCAGAAAYGLAIKGPPADRMKAVMAGIVVLAPLNLIATTG